MRMSVKMDHSGQLQAVPIYPKIMARPPKLQLTAHILLKVTGMTVKRPLNFCQCSYNAYKRDIIAHGS